MSERLSYRRCFCPNDARYLQKGDVLVRRIRNYKRASVRGKRRVDQLPLLDDGKRCSAPSCPICCDSIQVRICKFSAQAQKRA